MKVFKDDTGPVARPNKLIEQGERTRAGILKVSVDIASAEGLEGLTIGRLAKELNMSKSGLFAHFGSKEDLQIATVDAASLNFVAEIVDPVDATENGLRKLTLLLHNWISYISKEVSRGGCFFFAVSAEMDDRPGKVRDFVAELTGSWVLALQEEVRHAIDRKELKSDCDAELLVFQLHGFVQEANWFYRLHRDELAFERARRSIRQSLEFFATREGKEVINGGKEL